MNKKAIIGVSVGVAIVVTLGVYFFAVPAVQVSNYKQVVGTKQSELNDSLNKLGTVLASDTFVKTEVEPTKIQSDIKSGKEHVKNVEAKIVLVKKDLTTFNELPLLDFNEKYKAAKSLKNDEKAYISKTESFVTEMKEVLNYFEKSNDLRIKSQDFAVEMEKAGESESLPEFANLLEKALANIQPAFDHVKTLTPPESLKEGHDYSVKSSNEMLDLCRQLVAAARTENLNKMLTINDQLTAKTQEMEKKNGEYSAKFIRESNLTKLYDSVIQLNHEISQKQANL